jgi:hypothetical protein
MGHDSLISRVFIAFALILFLIAILWLLFVLITGPQTVFGMAESSAAPVLLLFVVLVMFVIAMALSKLHRNRGHQDLHAEMHLQ